jgi:exopolysaccharide biosynthesis polyprenyl glycosylphosphotransferase
MTLILRMSREQLPLIAFMIAPLCFAALPAAAGGKANGRAASRRKWDFPLPRWVEKLAVILCDYFAINAAFFWWAHLRSELGMFSLTQQPLTGFYISNIVFAFWFFFFLFLGLYGPWNANSRFDELMAVIKTVGLGVLTIFMLTFDVERDLNDPLPGSRMLLVSYWLIVSACVGFARLSLRTVQRKLLERGIGLRRTLIVGWGPKARELFDKVSRFPALGYRVLGFVETRREDGDAAPQREVPILGEVNRLAQLIAAERIEEVLIALEEEDHSSLMQIIAQTDGAAVQLKIVPDLYSIITGQARTNQIYGFPLIEILPQYMPAWERRLKRAIDIGVSLIILLGALPVLVLVSIAIRLDTPGPVLYRQQRVGRNGKNFVIVKFRSMVHGAEKMTGPVWAGKDDPRITRVGRIIRKLRIDEIPQFINVLRGEMSLVGPRPERPFFVEKLKQEIPLYSRRLKVQPGITGWAQIKGDYDQSLDDVKQKLQYDLFYLENMSLRMDFKILLHTVYVMLAGRGH